MAPWENNSPFRGHFGGPFAGMARPNFGGPFHNGDSSDQHSHKPSFGPFGWHRFDRSPERHCHREPEHPRWGPFEHHRGYVRRGPSECHCCEPLTRGRRHERGCESPRSNRSHPWFGRNADQNCCGQRGQFDCSEYSCRHRCERHCRSEHHRSDCCRQVPCCDQRRQYYDNYCEERSRHSHCENFREPEPCCGGNKEDRESERDDSLSLDSKDDDEPANERNNKIKLVILWLLRELFFKTFKGYHQSDANMEIIITSTTALQRALGLDTE